MKLPVGRQEVRIHRSAYGEGIEIDDQFLFGEFTGNRESEFLWTEFEQIILLEAAN